MGRLKLLDLFCGEGGAAKGYADAGYHVHGVDTNPHRLMNYPFDCTQADALDYLAAHGHSYDLIHASPPCTGYSRGTVAVKDRAERYDRLIAATRAALEATGKPWVIENVEGARHEMRDPILLCGRMFGLHTHDTDGHLLALDRHRLFETPYPIKQPAHPVHHRGKITVAGAYGGARNDRRAAKKIRGGGYTPHYTVQQRLLGTPWMTPEGIRLAIPPAYTRWLGRRIRAVT